MLRTTIVFVLFAILLIGCTPSQDSNLTSPQSGDSDVIVSLRAHPDTITCSENSQSMVTAILTDDGGNPLQSGHTVLFTTDIGTITESAVTDAHGQATVIYQPENDRGEANIIATYYGAGGPVQGGGKVCVVDPAKPVAIEIEVSRTEIAAARTGGNSTSIITAKVTNGAGEVVTEERAVTFELIEEPQPPQGAILNGNGQREVVATVDGVATVGLNAGTQLGSKLLRVNAFNDENNEIQSICNSVAVVAGPPMFIDIDVDNRGEDAGGGAWRLEVVARVCDANRNPVSSGIPVMFSVEPEVATISNGFTGNENWVGDSNGGLAYAELVYLSSNTFDSYEITATVRSEQGNLQAGREHVLPLQHGEITLNADPSTWMFREDHEQVDIRVWVIVRDGHGVLINNCPVLFTTSLGSFSWLRADNGQFVDFYPDPAIRRTGEQTREIEEETGEATVYLRMEAGDVFF